MIQCRKNLVYFLAAATSFSIPFTYAHTHHSHHNYKGTNGHSAHDGHIHGPFHTGNSNSRGLFEVNESNYCGTKPLTKEQKEEAAGALKDYAAKLEKEGKKPGVFADDQIASIDVYWHVITDQSLGSVSDEQITKNMQILNDAYAGLPSTYEPCSSFTYEEGTEVKTPFVFELKGINRVDDADAFYLSSFTAVEKRREMRNGTCSDLNIFTGESFFLGAASLPYSCGVVDDVDDPFNEDVVLINYGAIVDGEKEGFNEGDVLIHEVGHWMGLEHTFEGGCLDLDYVLDTPAQSYASFGCEIGKDTCSGSGRDAIHNFMDYSDDCCMYRFTPGQVERMILAVDLYRNLTGNVTLPEVVAPTCGFPNDAFNYSECMVDDPCKVGNGFCDSDALAGYNTSECNFDGRDCLCEFPDDGFNYSSCNVGFPCYIGDGFCDFFYYSFDGSSYNSEECNFDGGDCTGQCEFPDDSFDYSSCNVEFPCYVGDGVCDFSYYSSENSSYYTEECNFDGGDCTDVECEFPDDGFDYSACNEYLGCAIGDGICDSLFDTDECNRDGRDCSLFNRLQQEIQQFLSSIVQISMDLVNALNEIFF